MPNNLNEICLISTSGGNLGQTYCPFTPTMVKAAFAIPDSARIPASALDTNATFFTYAKAQMQATNYEDRWHLIYGFIDNQSQGQETGYFTYPDRSRVPTQDAVIGVRYEHKNGSCYHKQLMQFNGGNYRFIAVRGTLEGATIIDGTTVLNTTTLVEEFTGVPKSLFKALPPIQATATDPERYMVDMDDMSYIDSTIKRAIFVVSPSLVQSLAPLGVKDVILENRTPSGASAGVFTVRPTLVGGKSLAEVNTSVISSTYIKIRNAVTKSAIVATTTLVDATDAANIVITADTADANYPAAGGFVEVYGVALNTFLTIGAYAVTPVVIPRS